MKTQRGKAGFISFGVLLLVCGLGILPAGAQEAPQKKAREKVVPDASLAAGRTHRWLFGSGYRDLWTTAFEVDVLDLRTYAGGLTITGTGTDETVEGHIRIREAR